MDFPPIPVRPETPPPPPPGPVSPAGALSWTAAGLFATSLLLLQVAGSPPGADPWLYDGRLYAIGLLFGAWWIRPRPGPGATYLLFFGYVLLQGVVYAIFWLTVAVDVARNGWPPRLGLVSHGFIYPGDLLVGAIALVLTFGGWIPGLLLSTCSRRWLPLAVAEFAGTAGAAWAFGA